MKRRPPRCPLDRPGRRAAPRPAARGFSLVEVLVSLVVVSVGLLGLAKMESLAIASTGVASSRSLAAILAVGNIVKKPVVGPNDEIVVGHRQSITLSCDHRVVDGAVGFAATVDVRPEAAANLVRQARDMASVTASPGAIPTASGEASVTLALRPSPATSARGRPHRPGSLLRNACRAKSGTARTAYLIRPALRPPGSGCAPSGRRAGRPGPPAARRRRGPAPDS